MYNNIILAVISALILPTLDNAMKLIPSSSLSKLLPSSTLSSTLSSTPSTMQIHDNIVNDNLVNIVNNVFDTHTSLALALKGPFGLEIGPIEIIGILLLTTIPIVIFGSIASNKKRQEEEDDAYRLAEIRARQIREEKEYSAVLSLRKKEMELQEEEKRKRLAKELQEESNRRVLMDQAERAKKDAEKKLFEEAQAKYDAEKKELERQEALKIIQQKQEEELQIRIANEKKAEQEEILRRAEIAKSRREQEEAAERDLKIKEALLKEAAAAEAWKKKQIAAKATVADKQTRIANAEIARANERALAMKLAAIEEEKRLEQLENAKKEELKKELLIKEANAAKLWKEKQQLKSRSIAAKYSNLSDKVTASPVEFVAPSIEQIVIPVAPAATPTLIETTASNKVATPVVPVASGAVSAYQDPNKGKSEVITIPNTRIGLSLDESLASFSGVDDQTRNEIDKKLNEALTILAKVPASRLKTFVTQYKPELWIEGPLEFERTLQLAAETGWSRSNGSFTNFVDLLNSEFKVDVTETGKWMRIAVANANELTESRVKELITIHGGRDVAPVKRKGEKLQKADFLSTLVEVLRFKFKNDYREVAMFLQNEKSVVSTKKGFGKK